MFSFSLVMYPVYSCEQEISEALWLDMISTGTVRTGQTSVNLLI